MMSTGLAAEQFELVERALLFLKRDERESATGIVAKLGSINSRFELQIEAQLHLRRTLLAYSHHVGKLSSGGIGYQLQPATKPPAFKPPKTLLQESRASIEQELRAMGDATQSCSTNSTTPAGSSACGVNSHAKRILAADEDRSRKTSQLREKLNRLIGNATALLKRDEPYVEERITASILREMKASGGAAMARSIKEQSGAIMRKQQKAISSSSSKQSEGRTASFLASNVNLLKQIKDRKVLNNDQIFECCKSLEVADNAPKSQGLKKLQQALTKLQNSAQSIRFIKKPISDSQNDWVEGLLREIDSRADTIIEELNKLNDAKSYEVDAKGSRATELQREKQKLFERLRQVQSELPAALS